MGFVGLEEIFLKVQDLDRRSISTAPISNVTEGTSYYKSRTPPDGIRAADRCTLPLQSLRTPSMKSSRRSHPRSIVTRGPIERKEPFKGRALFIFDPDGNETEVNTRYLYGGPLR